jgi:hypothetical protein
LVLAGASVVVDLVSSVFVVLFLVECFFVLCFLVVDFFMDPSSFFISVEVDSVDFVSVLFAASSAKAASERERIPAAARAMSFFKVTSWVSRWVDEVGDGF